MSVLIDVVTLAIIVFIVITSYKKGLVRSVIELVGYIAAYIVSYFLSKPFGGWIYSLFSPYATGSIEKYFNAQTGTQLNNLLANYKGLLSQFNIDQSVFGTVQSGQSQAGTAITGSIMSMIVQPLGEALGRIIAFVIIFIICMILVRFIAGLSDVIFKLPVISTFNSIGGAAIGVLKAVAILFVITVLVAALIPVLNMQGFTAITNDTLNNTVVYKFFYTINPLNGILLKN